MVLPSIATTLRFSRSVDTQFIKHDESSDGLIFSNTRLNVSLSGIPFGSSRNFAKFSLRLLPNSSISTKSSPPHITVHNPMIIISSSLCRIFPYPVLRGSFIFVISSFNFSISMSLIILLLSKKVNAVALAVLP